MSNLSKTAGVLLISALVALMGCSGENHMEDVRAANETNVGKIRSCYFLYKSRNNYKAPKNKEELVTFLQGNTRIEKNLERLGINPDELDSYFVSERDGQEVKIRWGVNGQFTPPVVFESEGVEGKFLVAGDEVSEVEKQEYDKLWAGKVKPLTPDDFSDEDLESS